MINSPGRNQGYVEVPFVSIIAVPRLCWRFVGVNTDFSPNKPCDFHTSVLPHLLFPLLGPKVDQTYWEVGLQGTRSIFNSHHCNRVTYESKSAPLVLKWL